MDFGIAQAIINLLIRYGPSAVSSAKKAWKKRTVRGVLKIGAEKLRDIWTVLDQQQNLSSDESTEKMKMMMEMYI
jgi:hypothetical protein